MKRLDRFIDEFKPTVTMRIYHNHLTRLPYEGYHLKFPRGYVSISQDTSKTGIPKKNFHVLASYGSYGLSFNVAEEYRRFLKIAPAPASSHEPQGDQAIGNLYDAGIKKAVVFTTIAGSIGTVSERWNEINSWRRCE